jgi:hypothetical protein
VTQSAVLQEKLQEQVEEEAQAQVKAAEARLVSRLMNVMDAVSTRLGSLEERVEAAVVEAQESFRRWQAQAQANAEEQPEAAVAVAAGAGAEAGAAPSLDGPAAAQLAQDQARALETILGLAKQAKMAILEDVRAQHAHAD